MDWYAIARRVIGEIHAQLPVNATLAERKAALRAGYAFGERAMWPYKAWLKAQRAYLARYTGPPTNPAHLSPLERMMQKAKEA